MPTVGTVALDAVWAPCPAGTAVGDLAASVVSRLLRTVGRLVRGVAALLRGVRPRPLVAVRISGASRGAAGRSPAPGGGRRPGVAAVIRHTVADPLRSGGRGNGATAQVPAAHQRPPTDRMRTVVLPPDATAPGRARALLRAAARDWDVDGDLYQDAAMVVTELVANAVDHARTESTLTVCRDGRALRLSVRDARPCSPPRPRPIDPRAARGRGLQMVDALAAEWGVTPHQDGKTVWALLGGDRPGQEDRVADARATSA
jgi:anti-sigma regulatory factor (Ser/Thr protein kinase)